MAEKRLSHVVAIVTLLFVLMLYVIASQFYHSQSIEPTQVANINDCFARFGEPSRVCEVHRNGKCFYEFNGNPPPVYLFAHHSAPPAYLFDEKGKFVTWCKDPGDDSLYHETWQRTGDDEIDINSLKKKFAIR